MINERYYGMDMSRAVLMILGVFYHTSLLFNGQENWKLHSIYNLQSFSYLTFILHSFRMEAFFVISGFFFLLTYEKSNFNLFQRIKKLAIPMFFIGFTLNLFVNLVIHDERYDIVSLSYYIDGLWLGHLWFLGNLIFYFIFFYFILNYIRIPLIENRYFLFTIFIFVVPFFSVLMKFVGKSFFVPRFLFLSFEHLFYYAMYFFSGIFFFRNKDKFFSFLTLRFSLFSLLLYISLLFISEWFSLIISEKAGKAIYYYSHACSVVPVLAFLNWLGLKFKFFSSYFSARSYTIYLIHEPLIIVMCIFFAPYLIENNPYMAYISLVFVVVVSSLIFHDLIISRLKVFRFLFNGVYK